MRYVLTILLLTFTVTAAKAEDAAHRADRLYTQDLNRRAKAASERRDVHVAEPAGSYAAARARYERQMADWRRQVAACRGGDYGACDR